jgi:hypothetical protein
LETKVRGASFVKQKVYAYPAGQWPQGQAGIAIPRSIAATAPLGERNTARHARSQHLARL